MNLLDFLAIPCGALLTAFGVYFFRRGDRAGTSLPKAGPPDDAIFTIVAIAFLMVGPLLFFGEILIWLGLIDCTTRVCFPGR